MKRWFVGFLLIFAAVFNAKAICVQRNTREAAVHPRVCRISSSSQINHEDNRGTNNYFLETTDNAQMYRSPVRRIVSFFNGSFVYADKFRTYFSTLITLFPHASAGFIRSCKLMLFPFHVFW